MTEKPRVTIDAPSEFVILAARHLDAIEGPVQVGSVVDTSTRSAIDRVVAYVTKAHNAPPVASEKDAPRRPEDCPECGAPIHDLNTPKEQPAPDTGHGICTATINDKIKGRIFRCAQKAGHYDEGKMPGSISDPGGWHWSAPADGDDRIRWSDVADGATPHRPEPADATPATADPPPSGPAGASSASTGHVERLEIANRALKTASIEAIERAEQAEAARDRYARLADDRAEQRLRLTADCDGLRTRLAEQEAETMRQHEHAQRAEAAAGSYAGHAEQAEQRLRLAHQARRAKEHQLDGIRRALCDIGAMQDDDPYSHADLEDVIRQTFPKGDSKDAAPTTPDLLAETAAMLQEVAPAAPDAEPDTVTDSAWLSAQYVKALDEAFSTFNPDETEDAYLTTHIANAVMRVRDRHVAQLRQRLTLAEHFHQDIATVRELADRYAATLDRVRSAVHIADAGDATDWQRGYRACTDRVVAELDSKQAQAWTPPPPGDTREQLPEKMLDLIRAHRRGCH